MQPASLAEPSLIFPHLPGRDVITVLRSFADRLTAAEPALGDAEGLFQALWEREQLGSTGLGGGVAVPHCKMPDLERVLLAIGHTRDAVDFGAIDGNPVQLFFVVVSPSSEPAAHLQCLAAISKWVQHSDGVEPLLEIGDPQALYDALAGKTADT